MHRGRAMCRPTMNIYAYALSTWIFNINLNTSVWLKFKTSFGLEINDHASGRTMFMRYFYHMEL